MALQRLKTVCCVCLLYVCFAILASAAEFSPLAGEGYGQKYNPETWGQGIENPAQPQTLQETENDFYKDAAIAKDNDEKRGTKNDRLRGLRRLSRLHSELGYVKKAPETADGMYSLDDKRALVNHQIEGNQFEAPALDLPKRDAGPHAWYGTGMFGKRQDESRGRWRIRSPKPFRVGLFGKRDYETVDRDELARILESLYW